MGELLVKDGGAEARPPLGPGGGRKGGAGGGQGGGYRGGQQGGGSGYQGGGQQQPTYNAPAGGSSDDPWATGGTTSFGDEPPF